MVIKGVETVAGIATGVYVARFYHYIDLQFIVSGFLL